MRSKQLYIKRAIEASFLKLLDEMPFEKITVKNIVDDCGLTRNTFYNYFEDTYDIVDGLLRAQMCDVWQLTEQQGTDTAAYEMSRPLSGALRHVLQLANEHPKAVRHLFRSTKREELVCYFDKAIEITVSHMVDAAVGARRIEPPARRCIIDTCRYVAAGYFKDWVADGMQEPLDEVLERTDGLFAGWLDAAIEGAAERGKE